MTTRGTLHCLASFATILGGLAACATDSAAPSDDPPVEPPADDPPPPNDPPQPPAVAPKAVYILSNERDANRVVTFARANDGTLLAGNAYATGGKGSAGGLGSQGALVFDAKEKRFFAVNAGDHSISLMSLESDGSLTVSSNVSSGGVRPVSITARGDLVYVVNAGDTTTASNISGFRITNDVLQPIGGSSRALSAALPAPAQIEFSPDGSVLVVTEKATDVITTFVLTDGIASEPNVQTSVGKTPFGFAWASTGHLVVSEAFGGGPGLGASTSYSMASNGTLSSTNGSVGSTQSAPCWVVIAKGHAYTTNTASDTISSYTLGSNGTLTLDHADGIAAVTSGGPIDADASDDDGFLYVLDARGDSIGIYAIAANGALTQIPDLAGVSANAVGLVAR